MATSPSVSTITMLEDTCNISYILKNILILGINTVSKTRIKKTQAVLTTSNIKTLYNCKASGGDLQIQKELFYRGKKRHLFTHTVGSVSSYFKFKWLIIQTPKNLHVPFLLGFWQTVSNHYT